ncbi:MAG TPA: 4-vinyl reductase [Phototrophicaceae bacterium]|nr:4-vinyl reductase [Phototrophicaceae bacterium]
MLEPSGLYYPNRIARLFFLAMEDVMGKGGLNALLSLAELDTYIDEPPPNNLARQFDFVAISSMTQALENIYGARGGRGMALRIGRACFARGMKSFGAMAGMTDPAFVALPLSTKTRLGLDALAAIFTNFSDQHSTVKEFTDYYEFSTEVSPMAWGRTADKPVCHALTGIIQESLRWASDGYEFHVQEVNCRATGADACVFRVNKKPIGQVTHPE